MTLIRGSEDIGALDGLWEVAKDVVDVEEGFGCGGWAGDIYFSYVSIFF